MKFSAPNSKAIMELHGDQIEAFKENFVVSYSTGVMPLQKKVFEDKAWTSSSKSIATKEINIGLNEELEMITVDFSSKNTTK